MLIQEGNMDGKRSTKEILFGQDPKKSMWMVFKVFVIGSIFFGVSYFAVDFFYH